MKILLLGNYAPDRQHSMLHFSWLLESELQKAGHAVRVMRPKPRLGRAVRAGRGLSKWLGYADKFILLPLHLSRAKQWADVVHICDHAYSPYTRYLRDVPHVVTCHDLIAVRAARGEFPGVHTRWSGKRYQKMILSGLSCASHVACVSEATRSDLLRLSNRPALTTSVVHNALNFAYKPTSKGAAESRLDRLGICARERFILHVGANTWYKNHPGVVRIFARLAASPECRDCGLMMVTRGLTAVVKSQISECGLESRVRVLSNVSPEDLRALYSSATAFLFPSLYEGFGWPIIEAQACGCPVFTSNRPPMTEVGGNGAVYIDPEDPEGAAERILENLPRASRLREAGFVNARRFSAEKTVAGYLKAYTDAMKSAGRLSPAEAAHSTGPTVPYCELTEPDLTRQGL